jgi:2-C-methyl-D-erythritol 4-phosphate cytidylyltransferase
MNPEFEVILPACGRGKRFDSSLPKQYAVVEGAPVIVHTLRRFEGIPGLEGLIVVCDPEYRSEVEGMVNKYNVRHVKKIVDGGERRQDSVYSALKHIEKKKIVVIHDAVRPCVTAEMIVNGVQLAEKHGASCAAVPATQTLAIVNNGFITENLDRTACRVLQTPQVFKYDLIAEGYEKAQKEHFIATDDTQIVHHYTGNMVAIYPGSEENIKITFRKDLEIVASLLKKTYH